MTTIEVEGRKRLRAKQEKVAKSVRSNVYRAVAEVGEALLQEAMPGVPLEHGELRQSGYVDHAPGIADVGFSAPYAVYVHEMGISVYPERAPINWTTPGTGAKFLTGPFLRNRDRYKSHIFDAARKGLR
jgi:hypothetical protein